VPALPSLYPRGLVQSSPAVYVRFHSRNAGAWYSSDKERYDYDFSDAELCQWIEALSANPQATDRVLLLFNNCQRSHAAANAARMRELLSRFRPGAEIVAPFAAPDTSGRQGLLFDS